MTEPRKEPRASVLNSADATTHVNHPPVQSWDDPHRHFVLTTTPTSQPVDGAAPAVNQFTTTAILLICILLGLSSHNY